MHGMLPSHILFTTSITVLKPYVTTTHRIHFHHPILLSNQPTVYIKPHLFLRPFFLPQTTSNRFAKLQAIKTKKRETFWTVTHDSLPALENKEARDSCSLRGSGSEKHRLRSYGRLHFPGTEYNKQTQKTMASFLSPASTERPKPLHH